MTRLAAIMVVLAVVMLGYSEIFWVRDVKTYADLWENQIKVEDKKILYYGESSNFTYAPGESDQRRISEILEDTLNTEVGHVDRGAQHAEVYKALIEQLPDGEKTVVVTLNLRSFSAGWIHSELENSIQQSLVLINDRPKFWNRFRLIFKGYDRKGLDQRWDDVHEAWDKETFNLPSGKDLHTISAWDEEVGNGGFIDSSGQWDMDKIHFATQLIKNYAFLIDTTENPRIADFDDIVELCERRGFHLVFHLLPENVERGEELLGADLMYFFDMNESLLTERYRSKGATVVNNLRILPDSLFIDRDFPTEHYAASGRRACAARLARAINRP